MKIKNKMLLSIFLLVNVLIADVVEDSFKTNHSIYYSDIDSFGTDIKVKYKIWSIYSEPVIVSNAKYTNIDSELKVNGKIYKTKNIPNNILNKCSMYELKILSKLNHSNTNPLYIEFDTGVMVKNKWSFNSPESPNWDKFILNDYNGYIKKDWAKDLYNDDISFISEKITSIKFDMTAVKYWINEENLKNSKISKSQYNQIKEKINREKRKISNYISNKKEEIKNRELPKLKNVWIDEDTNLMWQDEKHSSKEWDSYQNDISFKKVGNWNYANKYCNKLQLNDFNNWRLPNIDELSEIKNKRNNFNYTKAFRGVWSYSSKGRKKLSVGYHEYDKGEDLIYTEKKSIVNFIKCVREVE